MLKGMPWKSEASAMLSADTTPVYLNVMAVPPASKSTANEMLAPSILPSLMAILLPSGPVVVPVSLAPSALKEKPIMIGPCPASKDPDQSPSTPAANAGAAISSNPSSSTLSFDPMRPPTDRFGYAANHTTLARLAASAGLRCQRRRELPLSQRPAD